MRGGQRGLACLPELSLSAEASPLLLEATSCGSAAAMTVRVFEAPGEFRANARTLELVFT